jgi:hypothetical protein
MLNSTTNSELSRRELLGASALITSAGIASLALPATALADNGDALGQIYRLQAAFHRAKSTQDINLMMSLWDPNGTLNVQGDPNSPYTGFDQLKSFWLGSGSFTHHRFSLVPSFKIKIDLHGDEGFLYFECHDVANYTQPTRQIAADAFLAGTIHRHGRVWVFDEMTAGKSFPLSIDHYYFP